MKADDWWKTAVFYQVYPRSFQDSSGDGTGDLRGIEQRLDYLASTLGVDVVWLSPFYPSPMIDGGYDVSHLTDVDPLFWALQDFDALLQKAHQLGLKLVLDFIPNHTSDQHPWFVSARSWRLDSKRDWYLWRDPAPGGGPPNNWLSIFGGSAWALDSSTGQYYLHSFCKEQPDLNWRNPEVESALFEAARFWLDRDVDGFRVDAAHWIMKDPEWRDNPPNPSPGGYHKALGEYDSQLHLYDKAHPDVHAVYRRFRRLVDQYKRPRRFCAGEIHIYDLKEWASYYGRELDEFHMPFNFSLFNTPWEAVSVGELVDHLEDAIPPGGWPNYVLGHHDEARIATRLGPEYVRLAVMLLLTLRGTPTLYYGDEIGMCEVKIPAQKARDPWGRKRPGLSRDPSRTPMQWDGSESAGFSKGPPDSLWLPLARDHRDRNVARQLAEPDSLLNLYRRILQFRRESEALQRGDYHRIESLPRSILGYRREHPRQCLRILHNFGDCAAEVRVDEPCRVVLSTRREGEGKLVESRIQLQPCDGLVLEVNLPSCLQPG